MGMSVFWLTIYAMIELDIDYGEFLKDQITDPAERDITIKGNGVTNTLTLSLIDLKSTDYHQVSNRLFHFVNAIGREFDKTYSGVSLWSILETENILKPSASTFLFVGNDGFQSKEPLSLQLAEDNLDDVILAYEEDGQPIFNGGPVRSVVDYDVIPDEITTHFWVQNLRYIIIN